MPSLAAAPGVSALRLPRRSARRRCAAPPRALFGGLFGGKKDAEQRSADAAAPSGESPLPPGAATILEGTILDGQRVVLSYDAARDGWTAAAFHRCVDNKARRRACSAHIEDRRVTARLR